MDVRLKVLLRLLVQGDALDKAVSYAGIAASVAGAIIAMWVGKEYSLSWWIVAGIGVLVLLLRTIWQATALIWRLEEAAKPKLVFGEIVSTERPYKLHGTTRKFEIEITNDSQVILEECCVYLTAIAGHDGSAPCVEQLPRALLTRENENRDGEGRFRLRPKQPKLISLCTRADGPQQEILFGYEGKAEPYWSFSTIQCTDISVTLIAYGAVTPSVIVLRLRVENAHRLCVSKDGPIESNVVP